MIKSCAVALIGFTCCAAFTGSEASPLSYDVGFSAEYGNGPSLQVSGTITTNGHTGGVLATDVVSYDLKVEVQNLGISYINLTDQNSSIIISGDDFQATDKALEFHYLSDNGFLSISNSDQTQFLFLYSATPMPSAYFTSYPNIVEAATKSDGFSQVLSQGAVLTVGTVSGVPLPASAPMFGAALLSLAALGYAAKRKQAAASA